MCSKVSFIASGNIAACNNLVDNCIIILIHSDISILASNINYEHGMSAVGATDAPRITQPNLSLKFDQESKIWNLNLDYKPIWPALICFEAVADLLTFLHFRVMVAVMKSLNMTCLWHVSTTLKKFYLHLQAWVASRIQKCILDLKHSYSLNVNMKKNKCNDFKLYGKTYCMYDTVKVVLFAKKWDHDDAAITILVFINFIINWKHFSIRLVGGELRGSGDKEEGERF